MSSPDLESYVRRSRALLDATSPTTRRETRTWLVDPFLDTLGWDRTDCRPAVSVDETTLEYVYSIDSVPALFVAVESYKKTLNRDRATAILEAMMWSGVDRAIYTNGREFLFFAGTNAPDQFACQRSSLGDHDQPIAHYSRSKLTHHLEDDPRTHVARQLAVDRTSLVDSIVEELTTITDDTYTDEFEVTTRRFLGQLIVSFTHEEPISSSVGDVALEFTGIASSSEAAASRTDTSDEPITTTDTPVDSDPSSDNPEQDTGDVSTTTESDTGEGATTTESNNSEEATSEFVVRFFADRGSVGAIGHSSAEATLVHATEYLIERGLAGVTLPWGPDDGQTLLNDEPTRTDGSPMDSPHKLSNGWFLETAGDTESHAASVKALAERAGYRAMLTGSWEQT